MSCKKAIFKTKRLHSSVRKPCVLQSLCFSDHAALQPFAQSRIDSHPQRICIGLQSNPQRFEMRKLQPSRFDRSRARDFNSADETDLVLDINCFGTYGINSLKLCG